MKHTPLKRTGFLKRGKPLAKTSKKRRQEMPQMRAWHDAVFERDDSRCVKCLREGTDAHHIRCRNVAPEMKHDLTNGICLCRLCHTWFHCYPTMAKDWLKQTRPDQYEHLYGDKT